MKKKMTSTMRMKKVKMIRSKKKMTSTVKMGYSLKELGLLDSVSILQIRPGMFKEFFR